MLIGVFTAYVIVDICL